MNNDSDVNKDCDVYNNCNFYNNSEAKNVSNVKNVNDVNNDSDINYNCFVRAMLRVKKLTLRMTVMLRMKKSDIICDSDGKMKNWY